jgi:hypothetical protein
MRFKDHELYHASLSGAIAVRIGGPAAAARHHRALGGIKLYGLEDSVHPAVRLLNARALAELRARLCLFKGSPGGCCRRHGRMDLSGLGVAVDPKLAVISLGAGVLSDSALAVAGIRGRLVVWIAPLGPLGPLGSLGSLSLGLLFGRFFFGLAPVALLALESIVGFTGHLVLPGMTFRGYRDGWAATTAR